MGTQLWSWEGAFRVDSLHKSSLAISSPWLLWGGLSYSYGESCTSCHIQVSWHCFPSLFTHQESLAWPPASCPQARTCSAQVSLTWGSVNSPLSCHSEPCLPAQTYSVMEGTFGLHLLPLVLFLSLFRTSVLFTEAPQSPNIFCLE